MSDKDVRPSAMTKYLEKHNQRFAAMSKNARRVKIEQNHTWRIRLLPVQMGPDKEPFVDIAQHWWNKAPITCPKHTSEAWGGSPEFPCPICELSDRLRESGSEEINGIGYRIRCNLRVRSWCIVFDMEDQRGNVDDMPISEILNPYEFDMFKTTWESFAKYQKWAMSGRRGGKEPSEYGILDLETGCDMLATQGAKGVTLDRCDPGPIFPVDDPNYDSYIQKIWGRLHKPQIVIPTEKQLLEVAVKVEEYSEGGGGSRGGSGGRRRNRDEDDDRGRGRFDRGGGGGRGRTRDEEEEDSPRGGSSRRNRFGEDNEEDTPPRSSRRSQPAEDQPEPSAPPARRRASEPEAETQEEAPAPPPRKSQAARQAAEPEAQEETPSPRKSVTNGQSRRAAPEPEPEPEAQEETPEPASPPPARRGSTPAAPPSARRSAPAGEDNDGDTAPQKPPTRRTAAAAPAAAGVDDEEDNAPEEKRDPAPPVREEVEDAPPEVSASAPQPKRTVGNSSDIKSRLERLNQKGR